MQELIDQLISHAGLTSEQAVKAIEAFRQFLHGKVPPMFHGMIDNFMDSEETLLDKMKETGEKVGGSMTDFAHKAGESAGDFMEKMKGMFTHTDASAHTDSQTPPTPGDAKK